MRVENNNEREARMDGRESCEPFGGDGCCSYGLFHTIESSPSLSVEIGPDVGFLRSETSISYKDLVRGSIYLKDEYNITILDT